MKAGFNIGLDRNKKRIITDTEYLMMEEFMDKYKIESSADVISNIQNYSEAKELGKEITKALVMFFHNSIDPRYVSVARNTSLFEFSGMEFGDFDGDLGKISLMEFVYNLQEDNLAELKKKLWASEVGTDDAQKDLSDDYLKKTDEAIKDANELTTASEIVNQLCDLDILGDEKSYNELIKEKSYKLNIDGSEQLAFILSGNATFTIRNSETGNRFTYKVTKKKEDERSLVENNLWFVKLLTGSNNESDYRFFGTIFQKPLWAYRHSKNSKINITAQGVKVFNWYIDILLKNKSLPDVIEFYHEGRCARCGRKLTVPESVESGFGPECINLRNK